MYQFLFFFSFIFLLLVDASPTSESYQYVNNPLGACYGVIDYDVFIPSGDMQVVLEQELQLVFDLIPKWLDKACFVSLKKYMCSSIMKASVSVDVTGYANVIVPSYSNRSVCENYKNSCGRLSESSESLARINAISPLL
jgi:hypothetical protein